MATVELTTKLAIKWLTGWATNTIYTINISDMRFYHETQNGKQLKTWKLFTSRIFCFISQDNAGSWITETEGKGDYWMLII